MDIRHLQWLMGKLRFQWRKLITSQQEQCALLGKVLSLGTVPQGHLLSILQAGAWPLTGCGPSRAWLGADRLAAALWWPRA